MKTIWFRAKRYGWGWFPNGWQGWMVLAVYLVGVFGLVVWNVPTLSSTHATFPTINFLIPFFIWTILLIFVCAATGEKLEWRWGNKKEK